MRAVTKRITPQAAATALALLLLGMTGAGAQGLAGLWGSTLYRVELTVTGTKVTGTFTSLDAPQAPAGKIAGQLQPGGEAFLADWAYPGGAETGSFKTSLNAAAAGRVLNGYRWMEDGWPAHFALHRAVNGQLVQLPNDNNVTGDAPTAPGKPPTQPPTQPANQPPTQPLTNAGLVVCRSIADGQPVGAADAFPRLPAVSCQLRYRGLAPQTVTCIWKRNGTEVTHSQRDLRGGDGWVSFTVRTNDPAGLPAGPWEAHITGANNKVLGAKAFAMGQVAGPLPTTQPASQGPAIILTGGASSVRGPASYPANGGILRARISYNAPGTIVDTVGLNAARPGDFAMTINAEGRLSWIIYNPSVPSAHRTSAGWHVLALGDKLKPGQWYAIEITWGTRGMSLRVVNGGTTQDPVKLKLSGKPMFLGDFPGDAAWGAGHDIHKSFTGKIADLTVE
jgi:hypothetical protein